MDGVKKSWWASFFRLFVFWKARNATAIDRAADAQFTGSPEGISDAFLLYKDQVVKNFKNLRTAVGKLQMGIETNTAELDRLNKEEAELIDQREGALAQAEAAKEKQDTEAYAKHASAFERFQNRIVEIESRQKELDVEMKKDSTEVNRLMIQLTKMQNEIKNLPKREAEEIAKHISAKTRIELYDQINGIQTSVDKGPIDAVLQANRELTAKANVVEKLSGADVELQDQEYKKIGQISSSNGTLEKMLAARKAEKETKTGTGEVKTAEKDARPQI